MAALLLGMSCLCWAAPEGALPLPCCRLACLTAAEVRQHLFNLIEIAYLRAGLLDATPQQHSGLAALEALLGSKGGSINASGGLGKREGAPSAGAWLEFNCRAPLAS